MFRWVFFSLTLIQKLLKNFRFFNIFSFFQNQKILCAKSSFTTALAIMNCCAWKASKLFFWLVVSTWKLFCKQAGTYTLLRKTFSSMSFPYLWVSYLLFSLAHFNSTNCTFRLKVTNHLCISLIKSKQISESIRFNCSTTSLT